MKLIECQNYNAIKITKDNYELLNDDTAPYKYSTMGDTLFCSLKNTNYCYIGQAEKDSTIYLYCNRVREPIEFYSRWDYEDIYDPEGTYGQMRDLIVLADIIPIPLHFEFEVKRFWQCGNPYKEIPQYIEEYPIDTNKDPDWEFIDNLNNEQLAFLLITKMAGCTTGDNFDMCDGKYTRTWCDWECKYRDIKK